MRSDSFPWSHYSETIEILLLQYIDTVFDVPVCRSTISTGGEDSRAPLVFDADVEKTVEIPQLQFVGLLVTCPSLCKDRCGAGRDSAVTVGVPQLALSLGQVDDMPAGVLTFWGRVHRHTARADPRHQGGEGVAGTPGVRLPGILPPELKSMHAHNHNNHNNHNHHKAQTGV